MMTLSTLNNGLSIWDLFDRHLDVADNSQWRRNIIPHDEDENGYHYFLNLAGFKKEDVDANIVDGLVTIKAKNESGSTASYSFLLPEDTDPSRMSAKLEDGLLTIDLDKEEKVKPHKLEIE